MLMLQTAVTIRIMKLRAFSLSISTSNKRLVDSMQNGPYKTELPRFYHEWGTMKAKQGTLARAVNIKRKKRNENWLKEMLP